VLDQVMSRAQVPPTQFAVTVAISPTVELIGVNDASIALVIVYSGLDADSVVPDGLMTSVVVPRPTIAASAVSTSDVAPVPPYDKKKVMLTSTD
jgi:hypothetical protein